MFDFKIKCGDCGSEDCAYDLFASQNYGILELSCNSCGKKETLEGC